MDESPVDHDSPLPDLSDVPLGEVLTLDESALAHALRRLHREADHPEQVLAGWSSAV